MKRILLCRHAKAEKARPGVDDRERVLEDRGVQDAARVATLLAEEPVERVYASSAPRAAETARLLFPGREVEYVDALYPGSGEGYLRFIQGLPDEYGYVALVGHNPAMEECVRFLVGREVVLKTSWCALVVCEVEGWRECDGKRKGRLAWVAMPEGLRGSADGG
ncbi:SixA phosphatase family protein [Spirochaeta thermophila]|uniref:Phosphohistidine phosphatase, SixA n=1 Tax=Winmispira thermophila (strain ATCC 49972 / DSM 6192 / RI 19.B1) TaxID=665571 RepID=E0RRN0_WINT6|nr:histidine phosphatase family protein [Spirochaeta thermophila]ADN03134.1 hypothetical protein STHERM_c22070 [Spirochaeta thermophila DSM 6192]